MPDEMVHATCIAFIPPIQMFKIATDAPVPAILLRGRSGSGKSDLALRLISSPGPDWLVGTARLVGDDQILLRQQEGRLIARAPQKLSGVLEVRGCGLIRLPHRALLDSAQPVLLVDLIDQGETVERFPEPDQITLANITLPRWRLAAHEPSSVEKIRLFLGLILGLVTDYTEIEGV